MSETHSFEALLAQFEMGDPAAATAVFDRFSQRLIALARTRLDNRMRQKTDPEDIVQSVFRSFFARQVDGQFDLKGWESLWAILTVITVRKCANAAARFDAARRDLRRETSVSGNEALNREPTPEEAVTLADLVERLTLETNEKDRPILELMLQGYKEKEILEKRAVSRSKIHRFRLQTQERLNRLLEDDTRN